MIWIAGFLTLWALCGAISMTIDRIPFALSGLYWSTSFIGQAFALPLLILAVVLALFAEGVALVLLIASAVLYAVIHLRNRAAGRKLLDAAGLKDMPIPALAGLTPLLTGASRVRRVKDLAYGDAGERNQLDLVMPRNPPAEPMPILIHVPGGGWFTGKKRQQALPLLHHLAARGWLCADLNYRLAPKHRLPAHVTDVLRAIAWVREHAHEHGGDPSRIAITGGSAGGHLTALAALAHDDPAFKPGFADADCSVAAAAPMYGRYDLLDRKHLLKQNHTTFVDGFLGTKIMPGKVGEIPELWHAVSPIDRVRADAPPMFVAHGSGDTLLPFEDAEDFTARLRAVSTAPVTHAQLRGIQHAWDLAVSALVWAHVRAIEGFLVRALAHGRAGAPVAAERESRLPAPGERELARAG